MIGDARVSIDDMSRLPITLASLTEVQRMACVAPVSLEHFTTRQVTTHQGFTFPKGAIVVANISRIMKDPAHFVDPHTFNPARKFPSKRLLDFPPPPL